MKRVSGITLAMFICAGLAGSTYNEVSSAPRVRRHFPRIDETFPSTVYVGFPGAFILRGINFKAAPTVTVGGLQATVTVVVPDTVVLVNLPSDITLGTQPVALTTPIGTATSSITVGTPTVAVLVSALASTRSLITDTVDEANAVKAFDALLDLISQDTANQSFVAALNTNEAFFDKVDNSPDITVVQTLALEELSQFFAEVLLAQDDEKKKEVEEKIIDKILEKILTKALEVFELIDKEAADKIAGQVVGAFRTISGTTNPETSIKLKFAYLDVLKGGRRSVLETELAITAFVNLIFSTAGIGGNPFANFVKLVAAIKLSADFAKNVNKNANAGNYANLIAAIKADIKKEEKALEEKNKKKEKK